MTPTDPANEAPGTGESGSTPMRPASPIDAGPTTNLPGVRLGLAAVGGVIGVTAIAAIAAGQVRPGAGAISAAVGGAGAALAHLLAGVAERPWRTQPIGRWAFTIMHLSLASILVVLAWIVSLYSLPALDRVSLALAAAGAWFGGLLAKVAVFGTFAGSVERRGR